MPELPEVEVTRRGIAARLHGARVLAVRCGRVLKAPEMALLGLLEVIFGILLAWLGAGEKPAPAVLTGGALVIGALVFNELLGWKEQK